MQICETVTARTLEALRAARDGALDADLVELRLDSLAPGEIDVAGALAGRRKPVVVTCRPEWEGGHFVGGEDERLRILGEAVRLGAEYVDVEWRADRSRLPRKDATRLVVSHHDLEGLPADLASRVWAMRSTGATVIKVAVMARRLGDCLTLRQAMGEGGPHVAIAMGEAGVVSRVLPSRFGSCWTYAGTAAPGQISAARLAREFRVRDASAATRVFAVAGSPLAHSASPAMHNAAFAAAKIDAVYVPLESKNAAELLAVSDALGVEGLSVTAPLKAALVALCETDDTARAIGAVNTLKRAGGANSWLARNFDADAFLDPLDRRGVALTARRAVVLGAGGAARAAAWALRTRGAIVAIAARDPERAEALARDLGVSAVSWPPAPGWDLLVNATPVGTWPHGDASPLDRGHGSGPIVYDLVYNPRETTLVRWAREAGAIAIGGLEMLISQAGRQCEWWTGRAIDRAVFARAAAEFLDVRFGVRDEADDV
jgi:3-dehydroquinate dehydratase/shikimate dehydrogenase